MQAPDLSETAQKIEAWFARHQRPLPWRETYDPYHVWVSEVMAQQTRIEVVLAYFDRFLQRFPTLASLANASDDEVTSAWSGLGYYRRARMLRDGARDVMERFGGRIPSTVEDLLTIKGIGRYTAGAIASIAHGTRAPIVDGNIARIAARLFAIEAPLGTPELMRTAWMHAEALVNACDAPRAFNQGWMEIGALLCKPRNPSCLLCPVSDVCAARASGRANELPLPKEKKATRELRIALYVVRDRNGRVLMRRESGPLMNAMYHLPHGDTSFLSGTPIAVNSPRLLGNVRHTVTTRKITFEVYAATVTRKPAEHDWIDPRAMHDVPHPSYVRKALALAE
ncbi:MAG TPA: A/G-specific adenine glycosylase [Thermoanaerobaculia bacterium]|nr:A/G-specific adenine glycosylase [Thermoanaerobaculia bacterium]